VRGLALVDGAGEVVEDFDVQAVDGGDLCDAAAHLACAEDAECGYAVGHAGAPVGGREG